MITATVTTYSTAQQYENDLVEIIDMICNDFNEENQPGNGWNSIVVGENDCYMRWLVDGKEVDQLFIVKVKGHGDVFSTAVCLDELSSLYNISFPDGQEISLAEVEYNDRLYWKRIRNGLNR